MENATTPMMKQYLEAKRACPDALLLFRMGDFYELFYEDAKIAARTLNLTLTSRDKGEDAPPMAGFPHHQLETYLARLISAGFRVAVCEQVEDPREAKGLVRREITRVVTPGTLTEELLLDPRQANYLAAVWPGDTAGIAWVELSTGEFWASVVPRRSIADHLARIGPSECLVPEEAAITPEEIRGHWMLTRRPDWAFHAPNALNRLTQQFRTVGVEGFGFDPERDGPALQAAGAVLDYLFETQKTALEHIERVRPYRSGDRLEIDCASRASLEITRTLRDGRREGSLLGALDRCVTVMGSRLLADWLSSPLNDKATIERRLDAVDEFFRTTPLLEGVQADLKNVCDLQRLVSRAVTGRVTPRDLRALARTLAALPELKARLAAVHAARLVELAAAIDPCTDLQRELESALVENCPLSCREGGFIRDGYHAELDELRQLRRGGKQWIARYQAEQIERTGIQTLKVGYNKVFGYYLEVSHSQQDRVPSNYIRKQTLKNAERYITPELKQYEEKVLSAEERARQLEYELFVRLRDAVAARRSALQATASALAELDVLSTLADLARRRRYCRPQVVEEPVLEIIEGRHPVLDAGPEGSSFVPNDTYVGPEVGEILIITGPNMAGKSTYIRQVALIVLMAQIGSFVPAKQATIGLADRIFARVGASDELARGQSTFMVEMLEMARILNLASPRSLVILDEVGRGTSTYDGISLAWAIVEHLHDRIGCRTLFATHYHELTDLARVCERVKNLNVAVRDWADEVVFLHKIVEGAADKSYGIHVARLAGIPREVISRAKQILAQLEAEHIDGQGRPRLAGRTRGKPRHDPYQLMLFVPSAHPVLEAIRSLDIDQTTPLQALQYLQQWKQELMQEQRCRMESQRGV